MTQKEGRTAAKRSIARLFAVQALYEMALSGRGAREVVADFRSQRIPEETAEHGYPVADEALFADLVLGAEHEASDIDDLLTAVLAEDWPLERLQILLRQLLRAAVFELGWCPDVPARVIMNEYIEIAHAFFSEGEPGMVNGLLDSLSRQLRPEDLDAQGGR